MNDLARTTDPDTSHEAVAGQPLNKLRSIVLGIYADAAGDRGMTDSELDAYYANNRELRDWPMVRYETPRKRRSDLVGFGFLRDSGLTETNPFGRQETVWECTRAGRDALEAVQS